MIIDQSSWNEILASSTEAYLHLLQFPKLGQWKENIFIRRFDQKAKIMSENTSLGRITSYGTWKPIWLKSGINM